MIKNKKKKPEEDGLSLALSFLCVALLLYFFQSYVSFSDTMTGILIGLFLILGSLGFFVEVSRKPTIVNFIEKSLPIFFLVFILILFAFIQNVWMETLLLLCFIFYLVNFFNLIGKFFSKPKTFSLKFLGEVLLYLSYSITFLLGIIQIAKIISS